MKGTCGECRCVGMLTTGRWGTKIDYMRRVYDPEALSPTLATVTGGGMEIKIVETHGCALRSRHYAGKDQALEVGESEIANAITTVRKDSMVQEEKKNIRIRKLTEREMWRLMDFDDADFDKARAVVSNTQLAKQAGNSIVVNVLTAIFGQLFDGKENLYKER